MGLWEPGNSKILIQLLPTRKWSCGVNQQKPDNGNQTPFGWQPQRLAHQVEICSVDRSYESQEFPREFTLLVSLRPVPHLSNEPKNTNLEIHGSIRQGWGSGVDSPHEFVEPWRKMNYGLGTHSQTPGCCQVMVWQKSHHKSLPNFWFGPNVGQSKRKTRQPHQVPTSVDRPILDHWDPRREYFSD